MATNLLTINKQPLLFMFDQLKSQLLLLLSSSYYNHSPPLLTVRPPLMNNGNRCTLKTFPLLCNILQSNNNTQSHQQQPQNGTTVRTPTTTLNELELDHFRKLTSKWWSGMEFAPLRSMNSLRVPFIVEAYQSKLSPIQIENKSNTRLSLNGVKLLDIGSGGGILSEALARLGAHVTGIDPVEENVKAASMHADVSFSSNSDHVPAYKFSTIEEFSTNSVNLGAFDGIIASEVLEHVDNIDNFLKCALDCLRPGGYFFVTTINQTPLAYVTVIRAAEDIFGLVPKGTHKYEKFVPPNALSLVLNDCKYKYCEIYFFY